MDHLGGDAAAGAGGEHRLYKYTFSQIQNDGTALFGSSDLNIMHADLRHLRPGQEGQQRRQQDEGLLHIWGDNI